MPTIHVNSETDTPHGWAFEVEVLDDAGNLRHHTVKLSWSDYDFWSHGQVAPEKVVEAVVAFWLGREPADAIKDQFDCSVVRRKYPDLDEALASLM